MSVDLSTYGVTPDDVARRLGDFALTDGPRPSRPSRSDVERYVRFQAARLSSELESSGMTLPDDLSSAYLLLCQEFVELGATIDAGLARGRGSEAMVETYRARIADILHVVRATPQRMGQEPSAPSTPTNARRSTPLDPSHLAGRMGRSSRGL
jgi:hypothetical protein